MQRSKRPPPPLGMGSSNRPSLNFDDPCLNWDDSTPALTRRLFHLANWQLLYQFGPLSSSTTWLNLRFPEGCGDPHPLPIGATCIKKFLLELWKLGLKFNISFSKISKLGSKFDTPSKKWGIKFDVILKNLQIVVKIWSPSKKWGINLIPQFSKISKLWSKFDLQANIGVSNLIPHFQKSPNWGQNLILKQILGIKSDTPFSKIQNWGQNLIHPFQKSPKVSEMGYQIWFTEQILAPFGGPILNSATAPQNYQARNFRIDFVECSTRHGIEKMGPTKRQNVKTSNERTKNISVADIMHQTGVLAGYKKRNWSSIIRSKCAQEAASGSGKALIYFANFGAGADVQKRQHDSHRRTLFR
jgi:hypothetical protein